MTRPSRPPPNGGGSIGIFIPPIDKIEQFWVDNYQCVQNAGYELRSRYQPTRPEPKPGHYWEQVWDAEEHYVFGPVMDAIRISDKTPVIMKKVDRVIHAHEAEIGVFLSSPSLSSNPRNHCVPIYDVFPIPDSDFDVVVMPLLRSFNDPEFDTVGEVIAFIQQLFEGMQFMHEHLVAHGDCTELNIMVDGSEMYPDGYHPWAQYFARDSLRWTAKRVGSRTRFWPKYYLIDFGLSHRYNPADPRPPLEYIVRGGDKSAPEHAQKFMFANPFSTDIYYLGSFIRENWTESQDPKSRKRFAFLRPLIDSMVQDDPVKRPTIDEVIIQFDQMWRKRRWRSNFKAAPCELTYIYDVYSTIGRRWGNYLKFRRSLPDIEPPKKRLPAELRWMYSGPPVACPEGQERPRILYVEDLISNPNILNPSAVQGLVNACNDVPKKEKPLPPLPLDISP